MLTKIDHLGIAVRNLDESIEYYENSLGLHCHGREEVDSQKVKTAFFEIGDVHLELLEPTSEDSPIAKFLEKNGEGIHHIAFRTDDIDQQLNKWMAQYVSDMDNPAPGVRARRPLRRAEIKVREVEGKQDWFLTRVQITPHLKFMGNSFELAEVSKMEKT